MGTWIVLIVLVVAVAAVLVAVGNGRKKRAAQQLADAREDALRWYERLGGQVMNLSGDTPAVKQALVDAGERYNAAGSQLERSTTVKQYELARETSLEGLAYVRAARVALGLDPGPDLPPLAGARAAGEITKDREVDVQGHSYRASPQPGNATPYYYPGGRVAGRGVPAGWYSEPWWKTALVAGAWGVGSVLVFDALFSPAWGDSGYDAGFNAGFDQGLDQGIDQAGDMGGADAGDYGDAGFGEAGDFGGGDWGGGDFGGDF
ncbi:hypothetical protein KZZ52_05150 [Dactylosporangium sp. AC04546]|uniref:hypothetical protein n=1 Tax=Dactylosporangium sp. AC04546 TaxID=2862460 RepID=UPI002E7B1B78|nr:hypothetical protein [Dactylosporangium sp. AC04546]WVK84801.1 hypothetical protein KZZ52_05150 [Dactylosporangium sp. AC04546]